MNTENKETNKPQLTEEELQGMYMYLSMHYEQMTQEEKNTWIILMNELDPEFSNIEDEE
jgi:succinate dehydrogenase flavin-adding protein (antitoxin of CptAB toxin-antitoxin module)